MGYEEITPLTEPERDLLAPTFWAWLMMGVDYEIERHIRYGTPVNSRAITTRASSVLYMISSCCQSECGETFHYSCSIGACKRFFSLDNDLR
ncbi:MAG: hypothetical protein CMQ05_04985 [Gammaproteobacteria bacterium]|nr:hypothetical protein [Gammaproteobacteria bacterium]|tara:strand:+ start:6072 stop:6347 length:276 start_codon:yes stop_codon:yes gene_type:complete